jgi:phosphatidate cytidylyltransferase
MLKTRVISACVGVPIIIIFIYFAPSILFSFFIFVMSFFSFLEYFNIVFSREKHIKLLKLIGVICGLILSFNVIFKFYEIFAILTYLVILLFFCFLFLEAENEKRFNYISQTLLGILYIGFLLPYLVFIRELEHGEKLVLILLGMVWASDTGAYFIGKKYGSRKLHYSVSPGKTVEGFFGGILASLLFAFICKYLVFDSLSYFNYAILALLTSIIGPIGDLSESLVKRANSVKDSGKLIPGHGGLLDRIDAVLFSAPIFYYYIKMLG